MKIGVLALQGAFSRHARVLTALGAEPVEVRTPNALERVDGLVLPGGESTTMSFLLDSSGLAAPLRHRLEHGMPTLGTCAGLILLATEVLDGRPDQQTFGALDMSVRRNAYGRQIDSFEADLDIWPPGPPFPAVFIRAPIIERVGGDIEVVATLDGEPVLVRHRDPHRPVWAASFHPELSDDLRIHARFLEEV